MTERDGEFDMYPHVDNVLDRNYVVKDGMVFTTAVIDGELMEFAIPLGEKMEAEGILKRMLGVTNE